MQTQQTWVRHICWKLPTAPFTTGQSTRVNQSTSWLFAAIRCAAVLLVFFHLPFPSLKTQPRLPEVMEAKYFASFQSKYAKVTSVLTFSVEDDEHCPKAHDAIVGS